MPSGGVPREGIKSDRLTGPIHAFQRAVHYSVPGRDKPPPTAVPTMWHGSLFVGVERDTPGNNYLSQVDVM